MKKKTLSLLLVMILCIGLSISASAVEGDIAYASTQNVLVNNTAVEFCAYALKDANGNDTNYVRLRDVAYALNGTGAQFDIEWDGTTNLISQTPYTPNGTEMSTPYSGNRPFTRMPSPVLIDGNTVTLDSFTILDDNGNGYTYFKLRDLGSALGFTVGWSNQYGIYIDTTKLPENNSDGTDPDTLAVTNVSLSKAASIIGSSYNIQFSLSADAAGGTGEYSFKFEIIQNDKVTKTVRWGEENSISGTLSGTGTCVVRITVRDSSGETATKTVDLLERGH